MILIEFHTKYLRKVLLSNSGSFIFILYGLLLHAVAARRTFHVFPPPLYYLILFIPLCFAGNTYFTANEHRIVSWCYLLNINHRVVFPQIIANGFIILRIRYPFAIDEILVLIGAGFKGD